MQNIQKNQDQSVLVEVRKLIEEEQVRILKTTGKSITELEAQARIFKNAPALHAKWRAASFRG
jgi:hypothetical protein